ncbi:formate dehydrogenase, subunit FdhD [Psychromonas ingrahamii 37]|uniref:Sulfur carrier protein FdhD n=1 Tax=Psychromonas ingrahamii (strain DSM 17664 / CCUG 51855 / 37) TaxID=357804 RepID=A1SWK3_PSYIN|nr:formate dehydrogenase accessory sulfurtransferase FdhD [Psychromonas ingrahamii]ABM03868.1 formate dehydrogenase, subunit FdhD [Psychromonas ingrahamii 37]
MAEQKVNQEDDWLGHKDSAFKVNFDQNSQQLYQSSLNTPSVVTCSRQKINGTQVSLSIDSVIVEEPLQISLIYSDRLGHEQERIYLVTMRTPGDDLNLVTGLLLAEGIIKKARDITGINDQLDTDEIFRNKINVHLSANVVVDWALINRDTTSFSSCGVCGKSSIQSLELRDIPALDTAEHWLSGHIIPYFGDQLRQSQAMFMQTGGVHGCGLFDAKGALLLSCEDVGRHNALDKLIGKLARSATLDQQKKIVFLSGRISFELVQKVLVAGISVLVAVGAPSNLAINIAKRFNLTLIGFSRNGGFNIYHGAFRLNLTTE